MTQKTAVEGPGNISFYCSHHILGFHCLKSRRLFSVEALDKAPTRAKSQGAFSLDVDPDFYLNGAIFGKTLSKAAVTAH